MGSATTTVHAPQSPEAQPSLVPQSRLLVRRKSRTVRSALDASSSTSSLLSRNWIIDAGDEKVDYMVRIVATEEVSVNLPGQLFILETLKIETIYPEYRPVCPQVLTDLLMIYWSGLGMIASPVTSTSSRFSPDPPRSITRKSRLSPRHNWKWCQVFLCKLIPCRPLVINKVRS